jgi:hypothetical protein
MTPLDPRKLQNPDIDFGERRTVHRASLGWVWWLVLCVVPILLVTAVTAGYAIKAITPNSSGGVAGAFGCLGGSGLLLLLVSAACLSDFRKWYATRTVKLVTYEKGMTYDSEGRREACSWKDLKDVNFKFIDVKTKYAAPRRVSVVRSIVKRDGTVISFAETLNLQKITSVIRERRAETKNHPD